MKSKVALSRESGGRSSWLQTSAIIRCGVAIAIAAVLWLLVATVLGWW